MEPRTREEIIAIQNRRTAFLVNNENSPVSLEARRKGFKGLEYFPIEKKYQFRLKLQEYPIPQRVNVSLSNGTSVQALRAGYLTFELNGKQLRLNVYKKKVEDTEVFLPFKDGTS